jgi:hypothetical protein
MADGKFDSSNQAHVSELARRLGYGVLVWSSVDGATKFETLLCVRLGDRELSYLTLSTLSPQYRPEGRAFALGLLARKVCAELLGEIARDARIEADGT